jgi:hypothetical protein
MSKAKWLILFLLAFAVAAPSYAVELNLGGFPSYMRIRPQFYHNATFLSQLSQQQAQSLGFSDNTDNIFFVDSRLRLTPQLVLSDAVTIRAQVDVMDNMIWGGTGNGLLNGANSASGQNIINSSLTPGDRFRGAILLGVNTPATDSPQFFNLRMIHLDLVLPENWGFMRIGRQPFDWGMGILANGGWDPYSDLGFILDRFLYLKSWGLGKGSFTFIFVSDRLQQGNTLVTASGDGWDGGAVAMVYNYGGFTIGGYVFPYIHQTAFLTPVPVLPTSPGGGPPGNSNLNLKRNTLWSGLLDYKSTYFRLVGEVQGEQGEVQVPGGGTLEINPSNIIFAARGEVYPGFPAKIIAGEFGYAPGDNKATKNFEGGVINFNPAYNIDNLLFKHMIPNIYQTETSVENAFYGRLWGTVKFTDHWTTTPQVLVAWTQKTNNPLFANEDNLLHNGGGVNKYLGLELEDTMSYEIVPGVNFDFIGSVVISGSGLKQLEQDQANLVCQGNPNCAALPASTTGNGGPKVPYALQGRVMVYIDQFFKK